MAGRNLAQLATIGIIVNRIEESVQARMPTPEERTTLDIPPGIPVITVARTMLTGDQRDQPIEAADIIIPTADVALDYVIDL